jgi:hypothetical protein
LVDFGEIPNLALENALCLPTKFGDDRCINTASRHENVENFEGLPPGPFGKFFKIFDIFAKSAIFCTTVLNFIPIRPIAAELEAKERQKKLSGLGDSGNFNYRRSRDNTP